MPTSRKRKKANPSRGGGAANSSGGSRLSLYAALIVAAALVAGVVYWTSGGSGGVGAGVTVPELRGVALSGAKAFAANCAACHGENAAGSEQGPPLIHKIYEPSHHPDGAFYNAARRGVRAHHWGFGNMAPVKDIDDRQLVEIVAYVRALQRANGIE
jgi:mono/diheme cytochrome c family protein